MTDRKVKITYTTEAAAVLWDGTQEAWDAILATDWDDCFLDDQAGTYCVYGARVTIPLGHYVTFEDRGRPLCFDPSKVTLAPTPPPTPQPGERWLLSIDIGGRTVEATVVEHNGETLFVFCDRTTGEYVARPVAKIFEGNRKRVES